MSSRTMKKVCVVVLGDIGRSPRMQYHSLSLADNDCKVDVIGYKESKINTTLTQHSNIHIHPLVPCPTIASKLLNYIVKTIWQIFTLLCALMFKRADYVLMQNPPAIPAMFICWFYCVLTRADFIIDWHNYAHTIMALNVGDDHILVKITKIVESFFGRRANGNLCVTQAMRKDLKENWNIDAVTLYDKPPSIFKPISLKEKHDLLLRLGQEYPILLDENDLTRTVFTQLNLEGNVELKPKRPGLLISSTSWTEDEDFSILLTALENFEKSCKSGNENNLPNLICIITGKGPLKNHFIKVIEQQKMQHVSIITPWLESSDYPLLLASADLGVCLHKSSSGLDLPMKIVDMFGCGLPVCAYDFKCLNELVKHNVNSFAFKNSNELFSQLTKWFQNFPNNEEQKIIEKKFKQELKKFQELRWNKNWELFAHPLFKNN